MAKRERQAKRTKTRVRARVTTAEADKPIPGFTRDISQNGLFIQVRNPLPPGTPIKIELMYPDGQIGLEGVVVRREQVPMHMQSVLKPGMGIKVQPSSGMARAAGTARPTRLPLGSDVVVFFGSERLRLKLQDLSSSGAALLAEEELPEMTFVRLHLKLPSIDGVIELDGVPVGQRPVGLGSLIAINFLDPPAEFLAQIESLIEERGAHEEE